MVRHDLSGPVVSAPAPLLLVVGAVLSAAPAAATGTATPNVIFVLADDMGFGDVGWTADAAMHPGAGNATWTANPPKTPHLDGLARAVGTVRFDRFYAGSPVCSPTRASVLTGRTPQRECIDSAEGCGQRPAWACYDSLPLPPTTFTAAEAAKARGYATFFAGKWHLGDFWVKDNPKPPHAGKLWPSSHPGHHGFDVWHATEASAESSTPNCGCDPSWKTLGDGCVVGGGAWTTTKALECTNYWRYADAGDRTRCTRPATTDRACVANLTEKIEGDDAEYIMDLFEEWMHGVLAEGGQPFFAFLWLHTNHVPHYALPEWYHKYTDVHGSPAGDYLGTISQMDAQIGRLRAILADAAVEDSTMLWFTVDNGAHTTPEGRPDGQLAAGNGLRQCKASIFEGGIRVPGFVRWPAGVVRPLERGETRQAPQAGARNAHAKAAGGIGGADAAVATSYLAGTFDFLPTLLELWGLPHPEPQWAADGVSLLGVLKGEVPRDTPRPRAMPFSLSGQTAIIHDEGAGGGTWKLVLHPQRGQCKVMLPPFKSGVRGPLLFRLDTDPTEDRDLCEEEPARCAAMARAAADLHASIDKSRTEETQCAARGTVLWRGERADEDGDGAHVHARADPGGAARGTTAPTVAYRAADDGCLSTMWVPPFHVLKISGDPEACEQRTARWVDDGAARALQHAHFPPTQCVVLEHDSCDADDNVVLVEACAASRPRRPAALYFEPHTGRIASRTCPGMCLADTITEAVASVATTPVALRACGADSLVFVREPER